MNATGAVAVGGEKHCSLGTLSLPVTVDNCIISHSFQVFEKFQHPIILGLDFLREKNAVLNVAENTLSLKDPITQNVFALEINTEINTGIARVCQTITILPRSITSVQVSISNLPKDQSILLEPSSALPERGLVGAKCLIDTVNNEMHFM